MVEKRVPGLFLIISTLAIIEFAIFIICVAYSSNQDIIKIYNADNEIVYEDIYNVGDISEFKKIYGIRSFNKEGYTVKRLGIDNAFPTRAWIATSVCVPLIFIMFVVFIVKVFEDVFHLKKDKEKQEQEDSKESDFEETRFEKLFTTLGRLNIYSLGGAVIFAVFMYWMVPDLLMYLSRVSYQTISELKWVILGLVIFAGIFIVLKTFFSYKTQTEIIKQQANIQKHRDRLSIESKLETKLQTNLLEDKSEDEPEEQEQLPLPE